VLNHSGVLMVFSCRCQLLAHTSTR
jgi:hypothetical protein